MARAPRAFRQADIKRALKGALELGLSVTGYDVDTVTGNIRVHTGTAGATNGNAFDSWLEKRNAR